MRAAVGTRSWGASRRLGVMLVAVALGVLGAVPIAAPAAAADDAAPPVAEAAVEPTTDTTEPAPGTSTATTDPTAPTTDPAAPTTDPHAPAVPTDAVVPVPAASVPPQDPEPVLTAAVEGTVLGWMDPLGGATVSVLDAVTGAVLGSVALGEWESDYRIEGLPPGQVKVMATRPGWVTDYADNRDTFATATVFTLVAGETLHQSWDPMVLYLDLTPGCVVHGTVTGAGSPLAGAVVDVLDATGTTILASTTTDASGAFRIDGLDLGEVQVRASAAGWDPGHLPGDHADTNVFTLDPYEVVGPVTIDLTRPVPVQGSIQGTVRGINAFPATAFDGPLPGVRVTAHDAATGAVVRSVRTDALGGFLLGSLPAGQYKVRAASTGWLTTYAYGRPSLATADVIPLAPGERLALTTPVVIPAEAVITGDVLGWMDPLGGATLTIFDADTGRVLRAVTLGEWESDYRIGNLPAGNIKVRASRPGWLTGWAGGGDSFATAATYQLVAGQVLERSWYTGALIIDLTPAVAFTGQVLGSGAPLAGATVAVLDATTGRVLRSVVTDATGAYRVDGLREGAVTVRVGKPGWVTELAPGDDPATPGVYHLRIWADIGPVVVDLAPHAVVEGTVLGVDDSADSPWDGPLSGVRVTAFDAATGRPLRSVTTDAAGTYRFTGLAAGQVKLRAAMPGWLTTFAVGHGSLASADVYALVPGGVVRPDAMVLYAEAVIEGQVLGHFDPLGGATVSVLDARTGAVLRSVTLDELTYEYRIGGLPAGEVKVRASRPGWITDYADNSPSFATAEVFTLVAGETLRQSWDPISLYLDLEEQVILTGTVTGIDDSVEAPWDGPLPGVRVTAFDAATGQAVRSVTTDSLGAYRITGLAPGGYKVRAQRTGWLTVFADGASTLAVADVYSGWGGEVLAVPEMVLRAEAVLTGEVMGYSHDPVTGWDDPLPGVTVTAFDVATGRAVRSAVTSSAPDAWGRFRIGGLPAGTYTLRAAKPGWVTSWAVDQPSRTLADQLTVVAGQHLDLPGVWPLFAEAVVTGQVLGWMDPLGGAVVSVIDADSGAVVRSVRADGDGYYRVGGLPTGHGGGRYVVRAAKAGWYPGYADGVRTRADATVYTLLAGQTLSQTWDPLVLYLDLSPVGGVYPSSLVGGGGCRAMTTAPV